MRISDWSSDVCSSDLWQPGGSAAVRSDGNRQHASGHGCCAAGTSPARHSAGVPGAACFSFPVEGFENAFASQRAAATCAKHAVGAHDDRAGFSEAFDAEMIVSGYRGRLIAHLMPFQAPDGDMVLDRDGNAM